jgi:hypothetical protein
MPPLPTGANPHLPQNLLLSYSLLLRRKNIKDKKKNIAVCLFEIKIAIQGDFLCCFHAYIHYNPNWFISSNSLHFTLVSFPWWSQPV